MGVNGYISFDNPLLSNKAERFPLQVPALSAFQSDFIFTNSADSHMSFQEYTESEPAIMALAQFELELFGHQKNFYPNHVIVVTWKNAYKKDGFGRVSFYFDLFILSYIEFILKFCQNSQLLISLTIEMLEHLN